MMNELTTRLRDAVQSLRRTSMPMADVIPMLQHAADRIAELEARPAAPVVAEGWRIVPDKITYKMKRAAGAFQGCAPWVIYEAMISAAPVHPVAPAVVAEGLNSAYSIPLEIIGYCTENVRKEFHAAVEMYRAANPAAHPVAGSPAEAGGISFDAWFKREYPIDHNGRRPNYQSRSVQDLMRDAWSARTSAAAAPMPAEHDGYTCAEIAQKFVDTVEENSRLKSGAAEPMPASECHKKRNNACTCSRKAMLCDGFGPDTAAPVPASEAVGYVDPMSITNIKAGVSTKEWLWAKPEAGNVALYTAAPMPASEAPADILETARCALEVAMQICDAVPTRLQNSEDSTLAHIGMMVNARPDGKQGYAIIRDALADVRKATAAPVPASEAASVFAYYKEVHPGWPEFNRSDEFSDGSSGGEALVKLSEVTNLAAPAAPTDANCKWPMCLSEQAQNDLADEIAEQLYGPATPPSVRDAQAGEGQ